MNDAVNEFFKRHYPAKLDRNLFDARSLPGGACGFEYQTRDGSMIFPAIKCADGFEMSVQGHFGAYSHPRDDFADSYTSVEILGPRVKEFEEHFSTNFSDTGECLYAYVPVAIVNDVIAKHGGLAA